MVVVVDDTPAGACDRILAGCELEGLASNLPNQELEEASLAGPGPVTGDPGYHD